LFGLFGLLFGLSLLLLLLGNHTLLGSYSLSDAISNQHTSRQPLLCDHASPFACRH
jgi:hypothetical protein